MALGWLVDVDSHERDVHVVPIADEVDHVSEAGCACGPGEEHTGTGSLFVHHSIDGRERQE